MVPVDDNIIFLFSILFFRLLQKQKQISHMCLRSSWRTSYAMLSVSLSKYFYCFVCVQSTYWPYICGAGVPNANKNATIFVCLAFDEMKMKIKEKQKLQNCDRDRPTFEHTVIRWVYVSFPVCIHFTVVFFYNHLNIRISNTDTFQPHWPQWYIGMVADRCQKKEKEKK